MEYCPHSTVVRAILFYFFLHTSSFVMWYEYDYLSIQYDYHYGEFDFSEDK